jgi:hypothetical protein
MKLGGEGEKWDWLTDVCHGVVLSLHSFRCIGVVGHEGSEVLSDIG